MAFGCSDADILRIAEAEYVAGCERIAETEYVTRSFGFTGSEYIAETQWVGDSYTASCLCRTKDKDRDKRI